MCWSLTESTCVSESSSKPVPLAEPSSVRSRALHCHRTSLHIHSGGGHFRMVHKGHV